MGPYVKRLIDPVLNLSSDDDMTLNEYISDLWAALAHYQSDPECYSDIHHFVLYRSYRKVFKRIRQDRKTWKVHIAEKILAWDPKPDELREGSRWFKMPAWWDQLARLMPPEYRERMKTVTRDEGALGKEVEFSNATVGFWARLLGDSLLNLEVNVESAEKRSKDDVQGLKQDLVQISKWCHVLRLYINSSTRIVEDILTQTSLDDAFNLPVIVRCMFPSLWSFLLLMFFSYVPQQMTTMIMLMTATWMSMQEMV